jgi:DNA-binding NarL/FixJ family response regulator
VLRLMAEGRSDKEIADALFVARSTASKHVAAVIAKLGADSRTAAVSAAHRHRLV